MPLASLNSRSSRVSHLSITSLGYAEAATSSRRIGTGLLQPMVQPITKQIRMYFINDSFMSLLTFFTVCQAKAIAPTGGFPARLYTLQNGCISRGADLSEGPWSSPLRRFVRDDWAEAVGEAYPSGFATHRYWRHRTLPDSRLRLLYIWRPH